MNLKPGTQNPERSTYRQIFKATSLFGGVQVFNIFIGMVRAKFVAVFLGATGVGILGLLNAPLQFIVSITGLGIATSAVRDISEAHGSGDQTKLAKAITTLTRLSWIAGLFGAVVTIIMAPFLSQWTFGNHEYTWAFIWLSITLLVQTISRGQITIIQGMRRLKDVAKASVYGSIVGLFTAVPLYYYFGVKGIVPSLIITTFTGLLLSWHFSRKVKIEPVKMSYRDTFCHGKSMAKLGIIITFTGILSTLTGAILSAFISRTGGVDQVGFYNSAWTIIGQSTGLVFAAMTTDYFPRLAAINHDDSKIGLLVNQQAEMVLIILAPILILLISTMPIIIHLVYTSAFLVVVIPANWMVLGILLKGLAWPVGFVFPAKGDLKIFGLIEISSMIFNIFINIIGYYLYGLEGLGLSIVIGYIFGLALTVVFANRKYNFRYNVETIKVSIINLILVSLVFSVSYFINRPASYYFGAIIFVTSVIFTLFEMDKRVSLKAAFVNLFGILKKNK